MIDNLPDRKTGVARVLLAEEDHEIRALWKTVLDRSGYDVTACDSATDLRDTVESFSAGAFRSVIDLVVCDARMLNDDLRHTVCRLQSARQFPSLVVIAAPKNFKSNKFTGGHTLSSG